MYSVSSLDRHYVIRTKKLAQHLLEKGFTLLKIDINREDPKFNIFLFQNTLELQQEIQNYKSQIKKG